MKATQLLKEFRQSINPPYRKKDILSVGVIIIILITIPITVSAVLVARYPNIEAAETAALFLFPASNSINQNTTFQVQIREDSGPDQVNTVQADLSYDASRLNLVSVTTSSAFEIEAETNVSAGTIFIARGTTTPKTGNQLVATVTFRTKTITGATTVNFLSSSMVASHATNTNILVSSVGGTYTVVDPPPTVSLTSPTNGSVISGSVNVTANASDNLGVSRVEFSVDSTSPFATDTTAPYSATWNTSTVSSGSHVLRATSFDTSGNYASDSITVTVDNQPPSTPTGLSARPVSLTQINLNWNASTDNIGVVGYDVYRNDVRIATVNTTSYQDSGLAPNTIYRYFVRAKDDQGNLSPASITVQTTTLKRGDLNSDGVVNVLDLSILLVNWRTNDPNSDLNDDGTVNVLDLSIMLTNWG